MIFLTGFLFFTYIVRHVCLDTSQVARPHVRFLEWLTLATQTSTSSRTLITATTRLNERILIEQTVTHLTKMDSAIHLSERHRSDILLGLSGMTREKACPRAGLTHRLQGGGKHSDNGKPGTSACHTNFNFVEDSDHGDDTVERANTYRANSDPFNRGGDSREVQDDTVDEKNDTFSPYVVPGDVSTLEAAGLGTNAPLADRQDNNFDPGVSVQLQQAKKQARGERYHSARSHVHPNCLLGLSTKIQPSNGPPCTTQRRRIKTAEGTGG